MRASELSVGRPYAKPTATDRAAMQRVDWLSALPEEYHLIRRHHPWFRAGLLEWYYLTLEDDLLPGLVRQAEPGPNVLVGNSATMSNNHLDAFASLRRRDDLDGRDLIVPLSYGDAPYAEVVVDAGRRLFGDRFKPLREYLPREEYGRLIASCGTVVMNHVRQQAMGNLMIAGLTGARVFMNGQNPAGRWLAAQGMTIDDVAHLHFGPLTASERAGNTAAIEALASRAARRRRTEALLQRIAATEIASMAA